MILRDLTLDGLEWENALQEFQEEQKDIFFLPSWYKTWLEHEKATAHCLHVILGDYIFLYPFLKSRIDNYSLDDNYYDIQTAYGYGGVIVNKFPVPEEVSLQFNKLVSRWLEDNKIVAEFIRVHPQLDRFKRDCSYNLVRKNVFIETTFNYRIPDKQARQNVSRALSSGAEVIYDTNFEFIDSFIELYRMTAERVRMDKYYHFDNRYFTKVKEELKDYSTLIHILFNGKIIGSGLYMLYGDKATLHLVGSNSEYQQIRINDLLYHGAIKFSIKNKAATLNVGGGLTLDPEDSLFKFKRKYSNNFKDVIIGKNVINQPIYTELVKQWSKKYPELVDKNQNYFLKYKLTRNLELEKKQLF